MSTADPKSKNIVWHEHSVSRDEREEMKGHKGAVLWFTGLSGSGKSTLANEVAFRLHELGAHTYVLDGDNVRHGLNKDLGFSAEDRVENIRRIGQVANLFRDSGTLVMTAFISPYSREREMAREIAGDSFIEVYVCPSLEICEERDPKGLYKKARAGEIPNFTGVSAPYEAPEKPEISVDTGAMSLAESAEMVVDYLRRREVITG